MRPTTASPAIVTPHIAETREFYVRHLGARLIFDCGWYINLQFAPGLTLQFMAPQPGFPVCNPAGLTYNFRVADVDETFHELIGRGLAVTTEPEDHPWGDRGFSLADPNGVTLYIYSDREPAPEFRAAFVGSPE